MSMGGLKAGRPAHFLDRARFAEFAVRDGDLIWGDYDLCFPIADLYENRI